MIAFSRGINSTVYENQGARGALTAIEYVTYAWGAVFDIMILLWAIISSARHDVESEIYG